MKTLGEGRAEALAARTGGSLGYVYGCAAERAVDLWRRVWNVNPTQRDAGKVLGVESVVQSAYLK